MIDQKLYRDNRSFLTRQSNNEFKVLLSGLCNHKVILKFIKKSAKEVAHCIARQ